MISIIIPVYNSDKYLKRCINSILKQTFIDLEIILVDDGSTDNSLKICEAYQKQDDRIRVIHKENGEAQAQGKQECRLQGRVYCVCRQ